MVNFHPSQRVSIADQSREKDGLKATTCASLLIVSVVLLVFFGLTMLYSTSYGQVGTKFFSMQLLWAGIGLAAALTVIAVGYRLLSDHSIFLVGIAFVLLVACLAFPAVNGAQRWIRLFGFSLQPSELAKPVLALYLAHYCSKPFRTGHEVFSRKGVLPALFVSGVLISGVLMG
jgi:cell division protein FtsW